MLFPVKINIIFGISTSNNVGISKIYAEKQVALHSLTFTEALIEAGNAKIIETIEAKVSSVERHLEVVEVEAFDKTTADRFFT